MLVIEVLMLLFKRVRLRLASDCIRLGVTHVRFPWILPRRLQCEYGLHLITTEK